MSDSRKKSTFDFSFDSEYWNFLSFGPNTAQWGESFSKQTSVAIVIVFWLKWAGYLAVAGLNLLPLLSDRVSPGSV